MNHWPDVQVSAEPMITNPCTVGDAPWMRSAASGMKLSTPRNAAVASMRHDTTAGRPRAARCTPSGNRRRRLGRPTAKPGDRAADRGCDVLELQRGHERAHAGSREDRRGDARVAQRSGAPRCVRPHRPHRHHGDDGDQRQQQPEDPPPTELVGDRAGDDRGDEARQHPPGRQVGVHLRLPIGGERPLDQHVGDRCQPTRAGALQGAADHHQSHRRRGGRDDQAAGEHGEAGQVRLGRPVPIGQLAGHDEGDQVGQRVTRQRHAVQRVAVQLIGDRRQRGQHRGDLERHHRHAEHQPDGQEPLLTIEPGDHRLVCCHRGEPGATNGHGRARSTDRARSSSSSSL